MRKIFRPTLTALVDDYAAGNLAYNMPPVANKQRAYVKNGTSSRIDVGSPVYITGLLDDDISYSSMQRQHLSTGYMLQCGAYDSSYVSRPVGIAMEPIVKDGIGEVYINGITAALLSDYTKDDPYARFDLGSGKSGNCVSSRCGGRYWIVGVSNDLADGKRFAFLYLIPQGHYDCITKERDCVGPTGTTIVEIDNSRVEVSCPLLLGTDSTIKKGTTVIVSWSAKTDKFEIIEMACP